MLKLNLIPMAVLLAVLGLCLTAQAEYRTNVSVSPVEQDANTYLVQVKITQKTDDGKDALLCAPKMLVKIGEPTRLGMGDEKLGQSITCEVLVNENQGTAEVTATITVKEGGTEKLATTQTLSLSRR